MNSTPDGQSAASGAQKEHLLFLLAALLVIIIYSNTLTGPFIFDDRPHKDFGFWRTLLYVTSHKSAENKAHRENSRSESKNIVTEYHLLVL